MPTQSALLHARFTFDLAPFYIEHQSVDLMLKQAELVTRATVKKRRSLDARTAEAQLEFSFINPDPALMGEFTPTWFVNPRECRHESKHLIEVSGS